MDKKLEARIARLERLLSRKNESLDNYVQSRINTFVDDVVSYANDMRDNIDQLVADIDSDDKNNDALITALIRLSSELFKCTEKASTVKSKLEAVL